MPDADGFAAAHGLRAAAHHHQRPCHRHGRYRDHQPGRSTSAFSCYAELDEIWQIVEQYYYQEPDTQAMLDSAEMGLLYGLGDPYTYYYTPDQYAQLWADDEGEYAGIGIQIMGNYATGLCTISRVFLDSPALDAGLRKGDVLTRVEDIDVVTTTLQDAVNIMRGEPGTPVNVQVQRGDQLLDFVVDRAVVHVNWVNSCMLDGDVGYISLYEFSGDWQPVLRRSPG